MVLKDLLDINKVIETSSTEEANRFLSSGWKLIDTYTSSFSSDSKDQIIMYVLGRLDE